MKTKIAIFFLVLFLPFAAANTLIPAGPENRAKDSENEGGTPKNNINYEVAGSTIPDCSHACGSCLPCTRVTVSFKCTIAESCPIAYRCMCKGKVFPVPSLRPRP
ncbi:protein EPIDERMAL PATTERNING FACTOR 2 [Cryptomeria japonica]|uniref:protein EPIDERMAL PATTERNING FACTOR 2 n=1 Tax=Cryptomeria japonica TaxID=3369 RepID=UPI0027DA1CDA|nr:protein EPIDERMAL PATTERNING FACTOR 2 [Cryptomeria japonica]